ncbi:hypothetical protein [Pedobacter sp. N23S346]|uniref:hypothetical protein n=1 Tax=Pedobacter sp. N23S346 TaxID=3402750 RepID=UPI003ACEB3F0
MKKTTTMLSLLMLQLVFSSFTPKDENYTSTADYEALSKLNVALFAEPETCEDDCSFDAQAAYGRNVDVFRDQLGGCLDAVMGDLILAYTGGLSYQHASSNFVSISDLMTETQPEAMACIGAADQHFEDMIGATGDEWEECSSECDN